MTEAVWSKAAARTVCQPIRRAYLLFGEDDRQKDEAIAALRAAAVLPDFADFDYEELTADTSSPDHILAAAHLAPFGSPVRLVLVRGAELYRRRDRAADAEALARGIATLAPGSCLVLRAAAEDDRSRKTALTSKLDAAVRQHGIVIRCQPLSDAALAESLMEAAAAAGKRLEPAAAERLISAAHRDRAALHNELEKAICYAGDSSTITRTMVDATRSYDPEDVMFRLVEAIGRREADLAMRLLHEVLRYDPKPQSVAGRMLALLSRQMRLLLQARDLIDRRVAPGAARALPPEIAADLPVDGSIAGMAWKAGELFAAARRWPRPALEAAFGAMLECDAANKGSGDGSADAVTNLELLIVRIACT